YWIPAEATVEGVGIDWNFDPTDKDFELIRRHYGKTIDGDDGGVTPKVKRPDLKIKPDGARSKVTLKPGQSQWAVFEIENDDNYVIETKGDKPTNFNLYGPDSKDHLDSGCFHDTQTWNARSIRPLEPGTWYVQLSLMKAQDQGSFEVSVRLT